MLFYTRRVDPKDVDVLLAEITLLNTRTELYTRFLRRRIYVRVSFSRSHQYF